MSEAEPTSDASEYRVCRGWSNRILIAALAGILFLTLYPFEFSPHANLPVGRSPVLLGVVNKGGGVFDVVLNILLFLPFGFGLAAKLRKKGKPRPSVLLGTWLAGAFLSYCIEFLQIYIPARDSGWEDVFSNSAGAAVGCIAFLALGESVLRVLSSVERAINAWLPARRAFAISLLCFAAWAFYSVHLEKQSHFDTWSRDDFLVFGNDATGRRPWKGNLFQVEIWSRAADSAAARQLTQAGNSVSPIGPPLVRFDFSSLPPGQEGAQLDIPLALPAASATPHNSNQLEASFDGAHLVASSLPVSDLVADLQQTNQFSVRVLFAPNDIANSSGRIVAISSPSGVPNLYVGQNDGELVFWFRNNLSVKRPALGWQISKLLVPGQTRDLLFSFDGSNIRLYVAGKKLQDRYWGPGTAFAGLFRRVKQGELNGYRDIFYGVVFLPIGCFFGIAARRLDRRKPTALLSAGLVSLLLPLILELELVALDHRSFSLTNFRLSVGMVLAGLLWINADRAHRSKAVQA